MFTEIFLHRNLHTLLARPRGAVKYYPQLLPDIKDHFTLSNRLFPPYRMPYSMLFL